MKTNNDNSNNDGSIIAIQAVGPNGTATFYPVTTVKGNNGMEIMIAVLEVLGTVPATSDVSQTLRESLRVITPLADIYPQLKAKLASIE